MRAGFPIIWQFAFWWLQYTDINEAFGLQSSDRRFDATGFDECAFGRKQILLDPGGSVPIDNCADERAIYLAMGEATLEGIPLEPQTLYVLRPGIVATLRSATGGRAMLCGGDAFSTPRHVWWNFVSSRRERIEQAKRDWRSGAFPSVPGDAEEFIPIPDTPLTVSYP